jgi:hypothetical protein
MKKIILLAAIAGFTAFHAQAQVTPKTPATTVPALTAKGTVEPEFKFVEETHDFGKITQGKPVSIEMQFTNIGKQPLIISAVEPACGCTVAKYTQTPIKSGQKGTITLTYNAAAPGPFNKVTTIKSNAKSPVKMIYFKGEVIATPATGTAAPSSK